MTGIVKLAHLPPMTAVEFADYMAAQQAEVAAKQAFYGVAYRLGQSAFTRGVAYGECPTDSADSAFRMGWQSGWSEARDVAAPVDFDGNPLLATEG
jgi:hypothetical protein